MQEFSTTRELSAETGLAVDKADARGENFAVERDWGIFRASGFGLPGSDRSGWLVTFAANDMSATGRICGYGYLIAHAIEGPSVHSDDLLVDPWQEENEDVDHPPRFGGRCLLLGGPWDERENERLMHLAAQQAWFESTPGGARVNLEHLDRWLISVGRGVGNGKLAD